LFLAFLEDVRECATGKNLGAGTLDIAWRFRAGRRALSYKSLRRKSGDEK
jgi:hypothetical protein